ncbi:MAG TPA: galactose ABC transporter substrate-binding protein [Ruminococcaceae bacterium]|jgi:methyl-galactoside transport system substrate-binding protein|nr:galactose ABC transporter substrate-binding protein [Oscillospiraceae bacterium]
MKKIIIKGIFVVILCFSFCAMGSCGAKSVSADKIKIGVMTYRKDDTFINSLCSSLNSYAKQKEKEIGRQIQITIVDSQSNQVLQDDQVSRFLSRGYSALCVNLVDRTAAATIVNKAQRIGVPLIFFNREPVDADLRMWDKAYYVGADAARSGTIQGEIVCDYYKANKSAVDRNGDGKIQYVMLEGEEGHQDALLRTEYSVGYLTKSDVGVEKLADGIANWQRSQAAEKMSQWLHTYGEKIEAVFCNNDEMALGAIDAIKDSRIKNKPVVVGVDGTQAGIEAIRSGDMLGTAYNDAKRQAEMIFDLSYALACGKDIPKNTLKDGHYVYVPYQTITSANVGQYI